MPNWNEILFEVNNEVKGGLPLGASVDKVRRKYLKEFAEYRGRNAIIYYSGWLGSNPTTGFNLDINDSDMTGFMTAVKDMDRGKGLDLILHTPGGSAEATEGIVIYLHKIFPDIEVFVPHMCMSAGTLLCCSARRIYLGKQSFLGPIDPQYGGISVYNIKKEIEEAKKGMNDSPEAQRYWEAIISKYPLAFYYRALDAIAVSSQLAKEWLSQYMFSDLDSKERKKIAGRITRKLNLNTGSHSKHFDYGYCKDIGLLVSPLEEDQKVQDLVLSLYHVCRIGTAQARIRKIIENNLSQSYICIAS